MHLPLYLSKVSAGFPSPAEDYLADTLDLSRHLIAHPAATFIIRAKEQSLIGIFDDDILIVDKSIKPICGKIVFVSIEDQFLIKRLHKKLNGKPILQSDYCAAIEVNNEIYILGVVIYVIHPV